MSVNDDNGGSAFPLKCNVASAETSSGEHSAWVIDHLQHHAGMSLRDYFAAAVLGAIYHDGMGMGREQTEIAVEAYEIADAMLEARKAVPE